MYALAGKIDINFLKDEISVVKGKRIFFKDLWPSIDEVKRTMENCLKSSFSNQTTKIFSRGLELEEN